MPYKLVLFPDASYFYRRTTSKPKTQIIPIDRNPFGSNASVVDIVQLEAHNLRVEVIYEFLKNIAENVATVDKTAREYEWCFDGFKFTPAGVDEKEGKGSVVVILKGSRRGFSGGEGEGEVEEMVGVEEEFDEE